MAEEERSDYERVSPNIVVVNDGDLSAPEPGDESESEEKSDRRPCYSHIQAQLGELSVEERSDSKCSSMASYSTTSSTTLIMNCSPAVQAQPPHEEASPEIVPAGRKPKSPPSRKKRTIATKNEITIVLAGKSGAGKSTLVKKLFGFQLDTKMSASSKSKDHSKLTHKMTAITTDGVTVNIIDTVGYNRKERRKRLKELSKLSNGKADLVLYCLPISPSSRFDDSNPDIMASLQDAFGRSVWKHCMVVLTFSNLAWSHISMDHQDQDTAIAEYKELIDEYVTRFKQQLDILDVEGVNVKSVFDIIDSNERKREKEWQIVFVPAGFTPDDQVLAGLKYTTITNVALDSSRNNSTSDEPSVETANRPPQPHTPEIQPRPHPPDIQPQPHPPEIQPQPHPPEIQPQPHPPEIQPQPHPPEIQPQPHPPEIQPQPHPPEIQPQPHPPEIQPQPHPPEIQPQPHPPEIQPQPHPPDIQPQPHPPDIQPQPYPPRDRENKALQEVEVTTEKWTEVLILELMKRSNLHCQVALLHFWYEPKRIARAFQNYNIQLISRTMGGGLAGGVTGGAVGGGVGLVIGTVGGPVGMGIGLTLGTVTGVIVGTLAGGGTATVMAHGLAIAAKEEEEAKKKETIAE